MLHALLGNKLKEAFRGSSFKPSEDSQTSSVFGLLQYLPAQTMWNLLRKSCGNHSSKRIEQSGELLNIQFWPRWSTKGSELPNSKYKEPDVFCEFDKFNLIVEAKKDDNSGQYEQQWQSEINAYLNEFPDAEKKLIFIAFGGNKTLKARKKLYVKGKEYTVLLASWQNLLNAIDKCKRESSGKEKRLLSDIILAFEKHGLLSLEWLETLSNEKCISHENIKIINFWQFCSVDFLKNFYENCNNNINSNSKNILALWQTH